MPAGAPLQPDRSRRLPPPPEPLGPQLAPPPSDGMRLGDRSGASGKRHGAEQRRPRKERGRGVTARLTDPSKCGQRGVSATQGAALAGGAASQGRRDLFGAAPLRSARVMRPPSHVANWAMLASLFLCVRAHSFTGRCALARWRKSECEHPGVHACVRSRCPACHGLCGRSARLRAHTEQRRAENKEPALSASVTAILAGAVMAAFQ